MRPAADRFAMSPVEGTDDDERARERDLAPAPPALAGAATPHAARSRGNWKRWFVALSLVVEVLWLGAIAYGLYRLVG
jgi:hypothetical protein